MSHPPEDTTPSSGRLRSLDTFRGLIMCTLAINGFAVAATAKRLGYGPDVDVDWAVGRIWQTLAFHNRHPHWNSQFYVVGCSFWDLIQPAFMFMVGVAMPYSYASRRSKGDSKSQLAAHALIRSVVLIALGVLLQTRNSWFDTNRLLTNVLSQIGLGYFFVFLLLEQKPKLQIAIGALVLAGFTAWLATYPVPEKMPRAAVESIQSLNVSPDLAEHFAITTNGSAQFDVALLNLIPHDKPIKPHAAGYATLNFVPSAITMLLGVLAGTLLRSDIPPGDKLRRLLLGGLICMVVAVVCSYTVCPMIKKIWTPAWTLQSGAYLLWTLAVLYWLIDVRGWHRWTWPFVIVGMNSLAMYLMSMLFGRWIADRFKNYLGSEVFAGPYGSTLQAVCVFCVLWLMCLYFYRNKIFFRV